MRQDELIKKDIVDELAWDSRIDASKVSVTVSNGIVTLEGEVPTYGDITAARAAAWRMGGVLDVIDNLSVHHVVPPELPTDSEIETRIVNVLAWDPVIDETAITVTVVGGVTTLEGTVDAHWKKSFIESKVAGIRGVTGIENLLAVTPSADFSDEAIAESVVAALDRDVLVDATDVTVNVDKGVVTLTGLVPSWASRRAAENDALMTAGVLGVRNELNVEPEII